MKKNYLTICLRAFIIIASVLLFPVSAYNQDLTDAQKQERCRNNKNRIDELEAQLSVINADLSASMTKTEWEDAKSKLAFLNSLKFEVNYNEDILTKVKKIGAQYNINNTMGSSIDHNGFEFEILGQGFLDLKKVIADKIDKDKPLNRLALQAKKKETEKQLTAHRNNLITLSCDQPTDISGNWTSNIDVSYSISQNQSAFTWSAPKLHSKGEGTVTGNSISATWTGDWGPGSATGTIKSETNGRATQIDWNNGVVFKRN